MYAKTVIIAGIKQRDSYIVFACTVSPSIEQTAPWTLPPLLVQPLIVQPHAGLPPPTRCRRTRSHARGTFVEKAAAAHRATAEARTFRRATAKCFLEERAGRIVRGEGRIRGRSSEIGAAGQGRLRPLVAEAAPGRRLLVSRRGHVAGRGVGGARCLWSAHIGLQTHDLALRGREGDVGDIVGVVAADEGQEGHDDVGDEDEADGVDDPLIVRNLVEKAG